MFKEKTTSNRVGCSQNLALKILHTDSAISFEPLLEKTDEPKNSHKEFEKSNASNILMSI